MMFAETFIIRDSGNNQYYVHNDIFRLILEYPCLFQQVLEYT